MAIKVTGVENLIGMIFRDEEKTTKAARLAMYGKARELRDKARSNAPVDEENLEKSIVAKKEADWSQHGRIKVEVGVFQGGGDELDTGLQEPDSNVIIDDYATEMHEHLAPYGSPYGSYYQNLGEKSKEKAAAGHDVGGKFLERAFDEVQPTVLKYIQDEVDKVL